MKKISLLLIAMQLNISCQDAKDKTTESVTNSVIEKTLDQVGVASENIERANQNQANIEITYDGKPLFTTEENFKTIMNIAGKQMMVFSIDSDDAKINIAFSGLKNMLDVKPISGKNEEGKLDPKDANGTVVSITMAKENEYAYTLLEGEATISKLNQDEVIIDFAGKAGSFLDANKPENWKPIQGKIVSKYPVMNFIQIKKEDLFY
ncbi:hypothetical protein GOQ30_09955 [Flavobacterium sp. TP390]|uniref:Uncharacterized protein n=1 Tax=Flavobacterium profundi TaxID=1774945 RepID=A0A6I4IIE8_9FLAO|nr:hypothetical protein [Flavobacterium profundi]MVO09480.1 hypothetical protein [Flavobacterium profundi]